MIDPELAQLALRNRAVATTYATTGSIAIAATTLGFQRNDGGNFRTDGFREGMEVTGTGFSAANNAACIIKSLTTSFLTIDGGRTAQSSTSGRTLTVGFPAGRSWENIEYSPTTRVPYFGELYSFGKPFKTITIPSDTGQGEEGGVYSLSIYGLSGTGIGALRSYVHKTKLRFTPGTVLSAGSDNLRIIEVGGGTIKPLGDGRSVATLDVTWTAMTTNAVV